jgi:hypothetical protein
VTKIDRRLADLNAELAHLTGARAELLAEPAPAGRTTSRRRHRAPTKPSYEIMPSGKLIALLADGDGLSTRQLAAQSNADPSQVLALLKEQEEAGQVRRSGSRAATRWHAITDEDRIAARAAELEASSRRSRARRN